MTATKMTGSEISHVLKEGELEKRSDNLLQLWKRKTCVLTTDSLNIYADNQKKNKSKELKLQSIKKVDCVERTGKFGTSAFKCLQKCYNNILWLLSEHPQLFLKENQPFLEGVESPL
uniref:Pleckstrin homology-like domain family A member 2 n=1 Tax=Sinocyclocheilus rhinocerous TaxID=307959 RepID=A0A673MWS9_9TELE